MSLERRSDWHRKTNRLAPSRRLVLCNPIGNTRVRRNQIEIVQAGVLHRRERLQKRHPRQHLGMRLVMSKQRPQHRRLIRLISIDHKFFRLTEIHFYQSCL